MGGAVKQLRIMRGLERTAEKPEPVLAPTRIDFTDRTADNSLRHGWSTAEADHRWNDGTEASVVFTLTDVRPVRLRMNAMPFLADGNLAAQRADVSLNGKTLAQLVFSHQGFTTTELDLAPERLRFENTLLFHFPDATQPAAVGVNMDLRQLALGVKWIELSAAQP